jgi:hypothetical protein
MKLSHLLHAYSRRMPGQFDFRTAQFEGRVLPSIIDLNIIQLYIRRQEDYNYMKEYNQKSNIFAYSFSDDENFYIKDCLEG